MNYEDHEIEKTLLSLADLDAYFVVVASNIGSGLIQYVDRDGLNCWILADDRDDFVETCIKFLKNRGNPVLETRSEEENHVKFLLKRYSSSLNNDQRVQDGRG